MNQLLYKSFLQKIAAILLGIMAIGNAPLLSGTGNGVISVSVYEDKTTHQLQYYEMSDSQYQLMGQKGGEAYDPTASTTAVWRSSFQYQVGKEPIVLPNLATTTPISASSSPLKNFKDDDSISLFKLVSKAQLVQRAYAAIAFDATSSVAITGGVSSQTWSHTVTGSNPVLVVFSWVRTSEHTLSGVTYNGTSMSPVTSQINYNNSDAGYMSILTNPSTGTHNVVATYSGSGFAAGESISFTGAAQTGQPEASSTDPGDGASNNFSLTLTTVADNSWLVGSWQPIDGTCTAGANTVMRSTSSGVIQIGDNGTAQTPAGSHSMNMTSCGNRVAQKIVASIAPFVVIPSGNSQDLIIIQGE